MCSCILDFSDFNNLIINLQKNCSRAYTLQNVMLNDSYNAANFFTMFAII